MNARDKEIMDLFKIPHNPFKDEWVEHEIKWMGLDKHTESQHLGITMKTVNITGRLDDYLNKNFRGGEISCPIFKIDGQTWMSLTPMEIESNYMAWFMAEGNVGLGGLGLGYVPLRCAAEEAVESVTVFEKDPRVIQFFKDRYKDRPYFSKFVFIEGDVRETLKGMDFDYFYMDIYQTLLPNETILDLRYFNAENDIGTYRYWGQERVELDAASYGLMDGSFLSPYEQDYFRKWYAEDKSNMAHYEFDYEFIEGAIDSMTELAYR